MKNLIIQLLIFYQKNILLLCIFFAIFLFILFNKKVKYAPVCILLVVLKSLSYWLVSFLQHPKDPLSSIIMYRVVDIDVYTPSISAFSRLNFGDPVIFTPANTGLAGYLSPALFIHSLFYGFFKEAGYILADILFVLAFYFVMVAFLKRIRVSNFLAHTFSLFAALETDLIFYPGLSFEKFPFFAFHFWDLRITREFITTIPFLICLYLLFRLLSSEEDSRKAGYWVLLGLFFSILLQSEIYSMFVIAMLIPAAILFLFLKHRAHIYVLIKCALFMFITIAISSFHFIMRVNENKDFSLRLGVFPVDRWHPFFLTDARNFIELGVLFLLATILIMLINRVFTGKEKSDRVLGVLFLCFMCLAAYFSLPLSCIVLGRAVQPYHFPILWNNRIYPLAILIFLLYFLDMIPIKDNIKEWGKKASVIAVIFFSLFFIFSVADQRSKKSKHLRGTFSELGSGVNYRKEFVALIKELSKPEYRNKRIIGTFDWQLCSWWVSFSNGYSAIAFAANSALSDDEMESRLIYFCKLIGMGSGDFMSFINRGHNITYWLGADKYIANRDYTFAPIWDYDKQSQEEIKKHNFTDCWNVFIPLSEQSRLLKRFNAQSLEAEGIKPDIIVLYNNKTEKDFMPPEDAYSLKYVNPAFRLWVKK